MLLRSYARRDPFECCDPLLDRRVGDAPHARAALAGTQIIGLAMARKIVAIEPRATADPEWIAATIGPTIQYYLTGDAIPAA
jgi:hypothetical protein